MAESPDDILRYFAYEHLQDETMREMSKGFYDLAHRVVVTAPRCPERTVALRKLLEGKDAAVRACLPDQTSRGIRAATAGVPAGEP